MPTPRNGPRKRNTHKETRAKLVSSRLETRAAPVARTQDATVPAEAMGDRAAATQADERSTLLVRLLARIPPHALAGDAPSRSIFRFVSSSEIASTSSKHLPLSLFQASTSRPTRDPPAWCSRGALVTLAFGAVAATCATTAALRVGLPPMASLHTRGLSLSPPAATPARLEALRPLGAAPDPRLASLGAGVDPQVPLPGGGAPADRPVAGAGIYQPDWDEIDLGDDFRGGDGDFAAAEKDRDARRSTERLERPERPPPLPRRAATLGSYPYEDDGSIPWTRRLLPGYRGSREENRAMDDLVERDAAALSDDADSRDLDSFEGAFGDDTSGVLANAPRLRSLDRASRDAEASERAWDAEKRAGGGGEDGAAGRYEDAYENGLDARLDSGLDGDAYETSLRGDLDASYADAERAERRRRAKISRQRERARDAAAYETVRERRARPNESADASAASLGAARRATRKGGGGGSRGTNPPDAYFDYDYDYDYAPDDLPSLLPFPDDDYAPRDYGPYDYGPYGDAAGTGTRRAGTGTGTRRRRGRGRGGGGSAGSAEGSRRRRSSGGSVPGTLGDGGSRLGVPGLAQHVAYAGDGVGADSGSTRVLISVRPGEWGLAYLQLASLKRTSPKTLAHITVLTYDRATRAACAALGNGRDAGVDCFLDEAFLETWGDALGAEAVASRAGDGSNGALGAALNAALSWRKVHAAFELLQQDTPVVLLDADIVFLKDPTARWRDAMRRYDVAVAAIVGDVDEAQRAADTRVTLLPANAKTKELTKAWLKGESDASEFIDSNARSKGVDDDASALDDPARAYFNYALVPVVAGFARVHGLDAKSFANFLTAHRGADGAFDGVVAVSGGFCATSEAKERFLRSTLEEKARAEKALAREEAALGTARADRDGADAPAGARSGKKDDASEWASASARSAARRAARIVERKKARAEKRTKGLPLISSVDTQTHAAAVGVSGGDIGLDAGSDGQTDWPPAANPACDGAKREAAFRGEYRVTEDRRVVWER